MATTRIFIMGVIILFFGIQLRAVDTFVLNEQATKIINSRAKQSAAENNTYSAYTAIDPYLDEGSEPPTPASKKSISPPRWLGWSFCSIGAVLILTCPCFRS